MVDADIRPARPGDVEAICRIAERTWHAAYDDILRTGTIETALAEWYDPDQLGSAVERDDVGYVVAETEDGVVGFASGGPTDDPGVATLDTIYVDPDLWGDGIGHDLLAAVESFCREAGCDTLSVRVLAGNEVGLSFYRSEGFDAVEERETDLFEERVTDVRLEGAL